MRAKINEIVEREKNNRKSMKLKVNSLQSQQNWQTLNWPRKKKTIKIMKKWRDITTNFTKIKRIRTEYYELLYAKILDNLHSIEKFLERNILMKLTK